MKSFITNYGSLDIFNNDSYNMKFLSLGKIPDQDIIEKYLVDCLLQSTSVINVGGDIGAHDLLFTKINPSISIYSFEPRDEYFYLLSKNLAKNKIENVIIMNNALGHLTGPIDYSVSECVYDYDDIIEVNMGSLINNNKTYHMITLDSLHLLACDLLFINLDGFAYITLIGGIKTIKKFKPIICYRKTTVQLPFIKQDTNSCKELLEKLEYTITEDGDFVIAKSIYLAENLPEKLSEKLSESTEVQDLVNISDDLVANI